MSKIESILVATDGSEGAIKAAEMAGDLARALDASVHVVMVQSEDMIMPHAWGVGDYPAAAPYGTMPIEEVREMLEKRVRNNELPETASAVGKLDKEPEQVVIWGHPAKEICSFAEENDIDLIVIGSHGRSKIARALLGSVSNAVANQAPCPVTIVR